MTIVCRFLNSFSIVNKFQSIFLVAFIYSLFINAQEFSHFNKDHLLGLHHWEIPSKDPDRIMLNFNGDPSSTRAVTWRTDSSVKNAIAQIAISGVNSKFT